MSSGPTPAAVVIRFSGLAEGSSSVIEQPCGDGSLQATMAALRLAREQANELLSQALASRGQGESCGGPVLRWFAGDAHDLKPVQPAVLLHQQVLLGEARPFHPLLQRVLIVIATHLHPRERHTGAIEDDEIDAAIFHEADDEDDDDEEDEDEDATEATQAAAVASAATEQQPAAAKKSKHGQP
jgi:hypothetical protein